MIRAFAFAAVAFTVALPATAAPPAAAPAPVSAPAPAPVSAPVPARTLPAVAEVAFPDLPDIAAAPASIPAEERVAGLTLDPAPFGRDTTRIQATTGQCLRGPLEWSDPVERFRGSASSWIRSAAPVLPVRLERLVESEPGPALELTDLWIDPRTHGARLARTTRLPLTLIGVGPGDFRVYGFRAAGALHVVAPTEQSTIVSVSSGEFQSSECRHVRASLEPPAKGGGVLAQMGAFPRVEAPPIPFADAQPGRSVLTITVSLTQLSRDPAPMLSVRVAWARTNSVGPLNARNPEELGIDGPIPEAADE